MYYILTSIYFKRPILTPKKNAFRQTYLYNLPEHKFIYKKNREKENQTLTNQVQNLILLNFKI